MQLSKNSAKMTVLHIKLVVDNEHKLGVLNSKFS